MSFHAADHSVVAYCHCAASAAARTLAADCASWSRPRPSTIPCAQRDGTAAQVERENGARIEIETGLLCPSRTHRLIEERGPGVDVVHTGQPRVAHDDAFQVNREASGFHFLQSGIDRGEDRGGSTRKHADTHSADRSHSPHRDAAHTGRPPCPRRTRRKCTRGRSGTGRVAPGSGASSPPGPRRSGGWSGPARMPCRRSCNPSPRGYRRTGRWRWRPGSRRLLQLASGVYRGWMYRPGK